MYAKGSRYRNVTQSVHLTAAGERLLSTNVRPIVPLDGRFLHVVMDRDRLDLLAFKYYTDPTRWWLIADANPEQEFPIDLVDRRPIVEEELALAHKNYPQRVDALAAALAGIGTTVLLQIDLLTATVRVDYPGAPARAAVVSGIETAGFHLLSAWSDDAQTVEMFTFEDPKVKGQWESMVHAIRDLPGVIDLKPDIAAQALRLTYNGAVLRRDSILAELPKADFDIIPQQSDVLGRTGVSIVIPPNQTA